MRMPAMRRHDIDLSDLAPIVVIPPIRPIRDLADFTGTEIHLGYLGSVRPGG